MLQVIDYIMFVLIPLLIWAAVHSETPKKPIPKVYK